MIMINYPIRQKEYACPFYAFYGCGRGILVENQSSNGCGLILNHNYPCKMEIEGDTPNWNNCKFNRPDNRPILEKIANFQVFLSGEKSTIPFKDWYKQVMDEEF